MGLSVKILEFLALYLTVVLLLGLNFSKILVIGNLNFNARSRFFHTPTPHPPLKARGEEKKDHAISDHFVLWISWIRIRPINHSVKRTITRATAGCESSLRVARCVFIQSLFTQSQSAFSPHLLNPIKFKNSQWYCREEPATRLPTEAHAAILLLLQWS